MYSLAILSNYGLNSDGGGVKVYTHNLVKTLQQKYICVKLLIREGIPTEIEQKLSKNKLFYVTKAARILSREKPSFVLSQGGWFTAIPAMLYKSRTPEAVIVYLYHTYFDPTTSFKNKLIRWVEKLLMSFLLSRFDFVLFVSRGLRQNVEEAGALKVPPQWSILYGAPSVSIPSQKEVDSFKEKFGIKNSEIYLLALGLTALPAKVRGAKLLLDVLSALPKNVKLILTRKGRFVNQLKDYAKLKGVDERVIFTGDLSNPHVATFIADIYPHISYGEGLPLALLEVMAIGKPIVASSVGGIPEAIRHPLEGILVENNCESIVYAIKALVDNPKLRRKMSVVTRRAVSKRFSWEKTAEKLITLFRSLERKSKSLDG